MQYLQEKYSIYSTSIQSKVINVVYYKLFISIKNEPGVELPATGGPGTTLFYLLGIMLTGLAGAGLVMKRLRRNAA